MSANLFSVPDWDEDVPTINLNFNKKKNKSKGKNKKGHSGADVINHSTTNDDDNAPGRFVRINVAINLTNNKSTPLTKKRKHENTAVNNKNGRKTQHHDDDDGEKPIKKQKLTKAEKRAKKNEDRQNNVADQSKTNKSIQKNLANNKKDLFCENVNDEDPSTNSSSLVSVSSLREKLKGSRFRFLNEMLYSSEGSDAVKLFTDDKDAFKAYHDGYRQQVQQWPLNPLDRIIKSIRKMPKTIVVADFGCGEGRLARSISQKTYSLDLVANRDEIIACDMAKTPLETNSIDVAVYCLSLMGTNLKDFFLEANRVLKNNGQLKIAEVESRFSDTRQFIENVKKCGFTLVNQDLTKNLFVFINFKKVKNVDKDDKKISAFSLKPCLYKKR